MSQVFSLPVRPTCITSIMFYIIGVSLRQLSYQLLNMNVEICRIAQYRLTALATVISKVLELVILVKFELINDN